MDNFKKEVQEMSTADILLILEDQLDLYTDEEIKILRSELALRPDSEKVYTPLNEFDLNSDDYIEYEENLVGLNENIGPFEGQDLVYKIDGVRGRHIDIYMDKVVITTKVTIGSLLTNNATDGEKTVYYADCIGVQFKQSKFAIGYLQLETASSNGNNKHSNFWDENSFTFDTTVISNVKMLEVAEFVKSRVDAVKRGTNTYTQSNNSVSVADELLKLKQLLDMGVLSQEEFDLQKNKLLNS